jgi:hypothetical protein
VLKPLSLNSFLVFPERRIQYRRGFLCSIYCSGWYNDKESVQPFPNKGGSNEKDSVRVRFLCADRGAQPGLSLSYHLSPACAYACSSHTDRKPASCFSRHPHATSHQHARRHPTPEAQDFFTEEFNSSADLWSYFIIDGYQEKNRLVEEDEPKVSVRTDNGYLVFEINKNYQYVYVTYDPYIYTDVRIDVRAENFGVNNNNVSLICRYSDQGWYEFNIANNGLYSILYAEWKPSKQGFVYHLIANGGSNKIRMGKDVNEYTAICKGPRCSFSSTAMRRIHSLKGALPCAKDR